MIKLFRNIRKNLLADPPERAFSVPARKSHSGGRAGGKTSRHLKYPIGAIILMVIGILITLGINNWNEKRKVIKIEPKFLEEGKTNFEVT